MKKFCFAMCLVLAMIFSIPAFAEEIVLPDPGHYFGKPVNDGTIEFDAYPKEEFDAYTSVLINKYGLTITYEDKGEYGEFYLMDIPGVEKTRVVVSCYGVSPNSAIYGIDFTFADSYVLEELDVYGKQTQEPVGEVVWDNGRMISDPGDYLGYDIQCTERADDTDDFTKGYFKYRYEAIPVSDILTYAEALKESPYFSYTGSLDSDWYRLLYFSYIGPDAELQETCNEGRAEIGDYFRKGDLCIYIYDPYAAESEFAIYEYPGFTVNTDVSTIPENVYVPSDGEERCVFCNGGSCNTCGGSGQVYQWIPGEDDQRRVNCTSCMNGRCTFCDGDGWY